ncbi:protein translocase subunit SecF [Dietzia sp. ANT_WB102]|uniref:protein translocase subunit SecF n=1 Tax=Dietzia sp. ANT_WB102 TaxID=2597345 RepID=UPI0011EF297B|nr:protein translocase subunit SecF [Dietzia sp. ANT_WB102]KAA0919625.1 protein translocase subunit SecF [Dietzia sp. ANT_WB102]
MSTPTPTATEGGTAVRPDRADSLFTRLYTGTGAFGIVPNRRKFYILTILIVTVCLASIIFRGFSFGIDFTGGTKLTMPAGDIDKDRVAVVVEESVGEEPQMVQIVGAGNSRIVEVETRFLDTDEILAAKNALYDEFHPVTADGVASIEAIGDSARSESWGGQVTKNALIALGVFLVIVFGYIAFRFEWQMATAAVVALLYDVVTTAGVYSIVGFEVTPATVIGLLAILGFSLYDTVVVFDKVEENTRGIRHTASRTYAEEANLGVNQTLMRSIHTTVIGVLPLLSLVVIAVIILGVGTLQDLALVQMVGIITGTFSSVFLATPLLVTLKNRDPEIRRQTAKVLARREKSEANA